MYGAHYERQCDKFKAAEAEMVQAREEWLGGVAMKYERNSK